MEGGVFSCFLSKNMNVLQISKPKGNFKLNRESSLQTDDPFPKHCQEDSEITYKLLTKDEPVAYNVSVIVDVLIEVEREVAEPNNINVIQDNITVLKGKGRGGTWPKKSENLNTDTFCP